jgi:hypothetical protein
MRKAIAIGTLAVAIFSNRAAAQTAVEQDAIIRDFQRSVVDYTSRHQCLVTFPEAAAASPAPKIFTLPVAMVFRQIIAGVLSAPGGAALTGSASRLAQAPAELEPFPVNELIDFPKMLGDRLPPLPAPLEYRLIGNHLVIRDAEGDVIVAVLKSALGVIATRQ